MPQKCYGDNGVVCEGTGSCIVEVSGQQGAIIGWKSSCGGYASTTINGAEDTIEFKCEQIETPAPAQQPVQEAVAEQVKCVFINSNLNQKCYTSEGKFVCSGIETCVNEVSGEQGKTLAWKSSCGEENSYTIIDRNNEDITFMCVLLGSKIKGFLHADWKCGNGLEEKSIEGVDLTTCKSSELWKEYAEEYCKNNGGLKDYDVSDGCSMVAEKEGIFISS